MSSQHEDCRSARGGFSRCWGFQIVRAVCPTRGLRAPVGETLAVPKSGATWAKRARDVGKRAVPAPSSEQPDQIKLPGARCTRCCAIPRCTKKQPGTQPDRFQIPRELCLHDVTLGNGSLLACAQLNQ